MNRTLPLLFIMCIIIALPATAAQITSSTCNHPTEAVFQAYTGHSLGSVLQKGNAGTGASVLTASPGILAIDPGKALWENYIAAARDRVNYGLKSVTFTKIVPLYTQCGFDEAGNPIFPPHTITQRGTNNIRLWWPLMYELPGTTFTLSILYGTPTLYDNDGSGPNTRSWVHLEQWTWRVDVDLEHFEYLIQLFHELPFGKSEVPLISDEVLYERLMDGVADAKMALNAGNLGLAGEILGNMDLDLANYVLGTMPPYPYPTGACTGIANTNENPAACKILIDIEYLLKQGGLGSTAK